MRDERADPGDTGATASGHIRIDFVPVPESSTAFLLAAGVAVLGLSSIQARWKRTSPHASSSSR